MGWRWAWGHSVYNVATAAELEVYCFCSELTDARKLLRVELAYIINLPLEISATVVTWEFFRFPHVNTVPGVHIKYGGSVVLCSVHAKSHCTSCVQQAYCRSFFSPTVARLDTWCSGNREHEHSHLTDVQSCAFCIASGNIEQRTGASENIHKQKPLPDKHRTPTDGNCLCLSSLWNRN